MIDAAYLLAVGLPDYLPWLALGVVSLSLALWLIYWQLQRV